MFRNASMSDMVLISQILCTVTEKTKNIYLLGKNCGEITSILSNNQTTLQTSLETDIASFILYQRLIHQLLGNQLMNDV